MELNIYLADILSYVGLDFRAIEEGEAVLNGDYIILCGKYKDLVVACCVKSSRIFKQPYKIEIHLDKDFRKWKCLCSCKAGAGSKCKHIIAVLFHINRHRNIQQLSSTELEKVWGKQKKRPFEAIPLCSFCHVPGAADRNTTVDNRLAKTFLEKCMQAAETSKTALHYKKRKTADVSLNESPQELHKPLPDILINLNE